MKKNEAILKRQQGRLRFRNADMDFFYIWSLGIAHLFGLAPSQIMRAMQAVRDGDAASWRAAWLRLARGQAERAAGAVSAAERGQLLLGSAFARRSALQIMSSGSSDFRGEVAAMESECVAGASLCGIPIRPIEVPFEAASLPGYSIDHGPGARPLLVMVGGGDTFREDLFYFAGYPGWKRGYDVVMVDYPGQGMCPDRGFTFRIEMGAAISSAIDWALAERSNKGREAPSAIAVYGISGGGYFSAQAASSDARINAWIAATPIYDVAELFRIEFGAALRVPSRIASAAAKALGSVNEIARINLENYAWKFGTPDFAGAGKWVIAEAPKVDCSKIRCPSLFLVGEGEGAELKRQTKSIAETLRRNGVDVRVREFGADEGADAHCQVNNLKLAHQVVFDWLDELFGLKTADPRAIV